MLTPNHSLIPRDNALARMRVKRWEALADGIMDSAIVVRTESVRPAEKQDADILNRHNLAITRALEHIAGQLGEHEWREGATITLADLALASAPAFALRSLNKRSVV